MHEHVCWRFSLPKREVRTWGYTWAVGVRTETPAEFELVVGWDPSGLPTNPLLQVLNRLAANGRVVVSVPEDRAVYTGEDARVDGAPTTIRYLLENPAL